MLHRRLFSLFIYPPFSFFFLIPLVAGGGIAVAGGSTSVISSSFSGNSLFEGGQGGGLAFYANVLSVVASGTFFLNNTASFGGYQFSDEHQLQITHHACVVQHHSALSLIGSSSLQASF